MSLPKEPRQKMINIMYLVLTALLAINISAEILNAFKTITLSLEKSNVTVNSSTQQIFKSLTDKTTKPETRDKALVWHPKAENVINYSATAYTFIENLKKQLIKEAGGDPADPNSKFNEEDQNMVTRIMIKQGKGKELFKILEDYKKNVLKDDSIRLEFEKTLPLSLEMPKKMNDKKKNWEEANFYMAPTVGALSILSKFQNDIRNSENKIVTFCHEQVGKVEIIFDSYAAIVGQNTNYVMPGQKVEVRAGVGAFSKAAKPTISIGGSVVPLGEEGFALKEFTAEGVGQHTIPVKISYFNQTTGKAEDKMVNVEYTVASPSGASVALDEMNVMYVGWDNKVRIAASGAGDDKVQVSISGGGGGSLSKTGPGTYIARLTSPAEDCKINVTVDNKTSSFPFRVRRIPDPVATIGGVMSGDNMTSGQIRSQGGVGAFIKDFPLNIKYSVTSFTLSADNDEGTIDEAPCQGNTWSPKALSILKGLVGGRTVTVDNIRAVGPDGQSRKIPSLVYYIK